jgi:transposase
LLKFPVLFPHFAGLRVERLLVLDGVAHIEAHRSAATAHCPTCGRRSRRVHSRYVRRITDEPLGGRPVVVHFRVRRFFCVRRTCPKRTFAEQAPTLVQRYGRRSTILHSTLEHIGMALGGRPGARLSAALDRPVSRMTLLRLVRALPLPKGASPRVLGVDDWARKRGRTYGTILVDQERHTVVDLLPERTAQALTTWLQDHPGVEILCRDRAGAYADGARQGAPGAIQVADRWHLLVNLREALERLLTRHHAAVHAAAADLLPAPSVPPTINDEPAAANSVMSAQPTRVQREQAERRAQRQARYTEIQALHDQGLSARQIARTLRLARNTVRRFLRAEGFPERQPRRARPSLLTPYESYLGERWAAGCRNASMLWRELRGQGFTGGRSIVRAHLTRWREADGLVRLAAPPARPQYSVRQTSWLLLRNPSDLEPDERVFVAALGQRCPEAACAGELAQGFLAIVRQRDHDALDPWVEQAERSDLPELRGFAVGLRRDWAAVSAGLELPWSNGQTEGQVNKLKLLKRQMYGRASFELLRRRCLLAA